MDERQCVDASSSDEVRAAVLRTSCEPGSALEQWQKHTCGVKYRRWDKRCLQGGPRRKPVVAALPPRCWKG